MVLLALDTATPATVVGVQAGDGPVVVRRHDPGAGERPQHTTALLALAREALAELGLGLADVTRIGCGTGPGTFTGLRIGVATARSLAAAGGAEVVPVPTLQALAHAALGDGPGDVGRPGDAPRPAVDPPLGEAGSPGPGTRDVGRPGDAPRPAVDPPLVGGAGGAVAVLAVLDARRGEAFVQAFDAAGAPLAPAAAVRPEALEVPAGAVVVGDGALRFADRLGHAAHPDPARHRVDGAALVALARAGAPVPAASLVPEYVRAPDAVKRTRQ